MIDNSFNEIVCFSPFGGQLIREEVKGTLAGRAEPENVLETKGGSERDMFVYVPASGCPDAKQCQVLMVLRGEGSEASAREAMETYGLDKLAEEKHFILAFPNPTEKGWNYTAAADGEDDMDYLSRCFMTLPTGQGKVGGFIGMIYYVGLTPEASALLMTMSAIKPTNVAAIMLSGLPAGYAIPAGPEAPQNAWVCGSIPAAAAYLEKVNGTAGQAGETVEGRKVFTSPANSNVRHVLSAEPLSAKEIALAWDVLFSETRRWANDTYGTYQRRTDFAARGFVAHVNDTSLGVNNGYAHTWYEYVPPQLRGSKEKVPLLFYFHGIGCVPLYGAEQSGWHDIADKEGFIVVYPKPATNKMWNVWDEPILPSDHAFVLALVDHMKKTYPIDESRIYISGFSMGGMMTHSLACAYPDIFAAAAPCNAYNAGYLNRIGSVVGTPVARNVKVPVGHLNEVSKTKRKADAKKGAYGYRMPIFQNTGLLDGKWPVSAEGPDFMDRLATFSYWKAYNNIPDEPVEPISQYESGLKAPETFYDCEDERFLHHRWLSEDKGHPALFEMVLAKRMPHALDLRQLELAWAYIRRFARDPDGSLRVIE